MLQDQILSKNAQKVQEFLCQKGLDFKLWSL